MSNESPAPSLQVSRARLSRHNGSSAALSIASENSFSSRPGLGSRTSTYDDDFRYRTMITYLHKRMAASGWIPADNHRNPEDCLGVLMRRSRGNYVTAPEPLHHVLHGAVIRLNLVVAMAIRPQMLDGIIASLVPGQTEIRFKDGSQLQIIDSLSFAQPSTVKRLQYACVCRQERILLVWQNDLQEIIPQATRMEERLLSLIWGEAKLPFNILQMPTRTPSIMSSGLSSMGGFATPMNEKEKGISTIKVDDSVEDLEKDSSVDRPESLARPVMRTSAFFVGMSMCLTLVLLIGVYIGKLVSECLLDGTYIRLALIAPIPLLICVSLFFFQTIFTNIFQIVGPIGGSVTNSRFYSCHKPSLRRAYQDGFEPPHITIQMPVYKEGMDSVIIPTIRSLQAAISYYESHGGSASIFINDDGMRAGIPEEDAEQRREFYHDENIGWVARPKHNGEEGYVRHGKFKKASNMNFALNLSQKVESYLQEAIDAKLASDGTDMVDEIEEEEMYKAALARALEENPLARADGNIRVGEVILIVDSDTRVVSEYAPIIQRPFTDNPSSLLTVCSTVLPRCSCPLRLPLFSTRPVSCRLPEITLRTASHSSPTWFTPPFVSPLVPARLRRSSATMPSSAGKPSRTLEGVTIPDLWPTGLRATCQRTLTSPFVFRWLAM
jgi:hypothetical protein